MLRKIRGIPVDAAELRRAYFATRVIPHRQLQRMAQVIAFFADYLAEIGSRVALLQQEEERGCIRTARQYMRENFHAPLSLKEVAGVVALSPKYFSRLFAREVGESYVRQLNRIRIEKSKGQLLRPTCAWRRRRCARGSRASRTSIASSGRSRRCRPPTSAAPPAPM